MVVRLSPRTFTSPFEDRISFLGSRVGPVLPGPIATAIFAVGYPSPSGSEGRHVQVQHVHNMFTTYVLVLKVPVR